jgi:putative spermidine/putrescine transport system substrate-binding protein
MSRRAVIWSAIVAVVAIAAGLWWLTRPLPILTVTTWPGTYGRAQANAMFHPFGEEDRIDVHIADYDGGLDHVRAEVASKKYDWDVIDFELADAEKACRDGLLEPLDAIELPAGANGMAASQDFVKNALGPCWVGSVVFSQLIVYAPDKFAGTAPRTARDFFDLARFPGPRALHRGSARLNLELALLADGLGPADIYSTLSTPAGVARALNKLSTIRSSIVWWNDPAEPLQMLADGRAVMATALDGNVFDAETHRRRVGVIWDRELYELDVFGIPKGDPKKSRALAFISYATGTAPLARVADWVPYGPARRSSQAEVGKNPDLGIFMPPYLPTTKENFATALAVDDGWWHDHEADIAPLWQAWLDKGP